MPIRVERDGAWPEWLQGLLTLAIALAVFSLMIGRFAGALGQTGASGASQRFFGAEPRPAERPEVDFADVAGQQAAKREVQELIEYLRNPGRFEKLGAQMPRGALLMGPPGTGKTLLARALAGEAGVPSFSRSDSQFIELFVGVGAACVRNLFKTEEQLDRERLGALRESPAREPARLTS